MNTPLMMGIGVVGMLAAIPVTATAYAVPDTGKIRLPPRWWLGGSAPALPAGLLPPLTGAAAALVCTSPAVTAAWPAFWATAVVGVGLAVTDLRCRRLPHLLTGIIWVASIATFTGDAIAYGRADHLIRASIAAVTVSALLLLVAVALPGQLGLGDVNLIGALAFSLAWIGWSIMILGLLVGMAIQALVSSVGTIVSSVERTVPMGPALIMGWLVAIATAPTIGIPL